MVPCSGCGFTNPPGMRFCGQCGTRLREAAAPELTHRGISNSLAPSPDAPTAPPDGERKTITALFADIKGSMELIEDLDPEEARRIVDPALQRMMDAVHDYEGYVAQSTGDGIFALFGAPVAHEDHAQRAVFAALRIQESIERYAERLRQEIGITLQVRVGLNSGEALLRSLRKDDLHADYAPVGHSTGLAARMQSLAPAGGIVVSDATYRLAEGYFAFKPLGPARVKGVSEPVEIYEVVGIGPVRTRLQRSARRGLTRFVGRQHELERARQVLDSVRNGHGRIITLAGEAGVGKSRLTLEIKAHATQGWLVLETAAVSYGRAYPYLPVTELLKQYFQITAEDDERHRREKVTGRIFTLDRDLEDTLPPVFSLLGMASPAPSAPLSDPEVQRRRTRDALTRLFLREARHQPLLMIVEDLHWLDNESQAFLEAVSERLGETRLCLLMNYRPEYGYDWNAGRPVCTALRLEPLGREDASVLLAELLGRAPELNGLKQRILEKTGGNPFFMEEIVQSLVDEQVLVRDQGSHPAALQLTKPVAQIHIPPSVQGVLAARIDRLAAGDRALLQTLAVMGRRFSLRLVEQVAPEHARDLRRALARLSAADFIYEELGSPDPEYVFKHAVTQEVAYGSQLSDRRRLLHERTARALETHYARAADEHASELAHHYSRSGNAPKAVQYLQLAAQQALQRSAHAEAVEHLTAALPLLATLPEGTERDESELLLQVTLGRALMLVRGWDDPDTVRAFARVRELCEKLGASLNVLPALAMLFGFYVARGDYEAGRGLARRLLRIAESTAFPALLRVAHYIMGQVSLYLGEFVAAREHLERSAALESPDERLLYASFGVEDLGVGTRTLMALTLWHLGYPDRAVRKSDEALAMARTLGHAFTLAGALLTAGQVHLLRGEGAAAAELATALIAHSTEHGLLFDSVGGIVRGAAAAQQGRLEEGIDEMRRGFSALRVKGATFSAPALGRLADALGRLGRFREASEVLAEALERPQQTHERHGNSYLHQVKGELLLRQGESAERMEAAERCFQEAIAAARQQQARSLELSATTALARLRQRQGRGADGRRMLDEIYAWFTEGFATADLRAAKTLLQELR